MRLSLVMTVVLIAGCQSKNNPDDPRRTDGGPTVEGGSAADGPALDVPSLLDEAQGAQAIPRLTIVFENPSARPLYLLPGCVSEFTISPEAGGFQEYLGCREFCLCECGVCQSPTSCEARCANAGNKQVPAGGAARLRWIPRSYQREVHATFCASACKRSPRASTASRPWSTTRRRWTWGGPAPPPSASARTSSCPWPANCASPWSILAPTAPTAPPWPPAAEATDTRVLCELQEHRGPRRPARCRETLEAYRRGSACR